MYLLALIFADIRPSQLRNATGKNMDIDDRQVLKYQPSMTSRHKFQYLMTINGIK